ncbi:MAG: hypothetical protein ACRDPY_28605 [Streptosporangiaceae bacterium]
MPAAAEKITPELLEERARAADQAAADLERRAELGEDIPLADVEAHRAEARGHRFRIGAARKRAETQAAAERAAALAVLGDDVRAAAAQPGTEGLAARLARLATDAEHIRHDTREYNATVDGLQSRARALGVPAEHAPCGPRPDTGGLALTRAGIQAGETEVRRLRDIDHLIAAAASGQPADIPDVVVTHTLPPRPPQALLGAGGVVHPVPEMTENIKSQLDTGASILLTGSELDAWWTGVLDTGSIDQPARRGAQVAAAEVAERARWERVRADQREAHERHEAAALERVGRAGR